MDENKSSGQLLKEFVGHPDILGEEADTQIHLIHRFQTIVKMEGLFSQSIHSLPYPLVIFTWDGTIKAANEAFCRETNRLLKDVEDGKLNIICKVTTENYEIIEAIYDVFSGESRLIKKLSNPLSMFIKDSDSISSAIYGKAFFSQLSRQMIKQHMERLYLWNRINSVSKSNSLG